MIRLADKEGAHRDVARITQGLAIRGGPVIIDQVVNLVNGNLADVEIVLVSKHRLETPPAILEAEGIDQMVLLIVRRLKLPKLVGVMEVVLKVEHLGAVSLVDPLVLVLLPGGQVPASVLRVDLVQVLGEEPVLLEVADAHQVGLVTVVVSVALKDNDN